MTNPPEHKPNRIVADDNSEQAKSSSSSAHVGQGGLALSAAKLYFMALGLGQQIALSWLLQDGYGALRGALSPASITYNPLISAGVQGMSRAVSRSGQTAAAVRKALLVHVCLAVFTASGFFLLAPLLGAWLNSEYLVPAFRVLSLVVLFYGLYAPLIGILNGQRRFLLQAAFDAFAATLRTAGLFIGAWWLASAGVLNAVVGATWGFSGAALVLLVCALAFVRLNGTGMGPTVKEQLGFVLPVMGGQVVLNLLLQSDTNTLRAFATRAAEALGQPVQSADALVAAYNAGQLFGFLPYQLLIGLTFILFPMLARAHADGDTGAVLTYTRAGLRVAMILTGLAVSVTAGLSENLLRLVFPPEFAVTGWRSMRILSVGLGGFAMYGVLLTVLNSLGKQWHSLAITGLALLAVVSINLLLVPGTRFGPELLVRTATATSLGIAVALGSALLAVQRFVGGTVSLSSTLKIALATAITVLLGQQVPSVGRLLTLGASVAAVGCYTLLLILSRELVAADFHYLATSLRRRIGKT